jgi:hypothetical protein
VKALATQTARSTEDITRHIAKVRAATDASVAAVARIEQTITEVNAIGESIAAAVEQQGAATAEIARNVGETAAAANEMTSRTAEVSTEASATGDQAAEVRENASGLERAMEELRHLLIRVVRTSTTEVERRTHPRHAMDHACRVMVGGESYAGRIVELSEAGAKVRGVPPQPAGVRGTIAVDGAGSALPFVVKHAEEGGLGIAFAVDAASRGQVIQMLERLHRDRAA